MPCSASLRAPAAVIQSVVQAGLQHRADLDVGEAGRRQRGAPGRRASRHRRAAGVGRRDRRRRRRRRRTSRPPRSTPRSASVSIGSSGSRHRRRRRPGRRRCHGGPGALTTSPPGGRGPRSASRRAAGPGARCARRPGRRGRRPTPSGAVGPVQRRRRPAPCRAPRRRRHGPPGRRRARRGEPRSTVRAGTARRASGQSAVERGLQPPVRLVGAVAEPEDPAGGVVAVVGQLLDALGGDRGEHRVARSRPARSSSASRQVENTSSRAISAREVAVGQLDEPRRCGTRRSSRKNASASSSRPAAARARAGAGEQQPGLAEQVQRDVGQRDLLLELGGVGAPLREPLRERPARRRRASGSTPPGRRRRRRRGRRGRRRPAGRRSRCRTPTRAVGAVSAASSWSTDSAQGSVRSSPIVACSHVRDVVGDRVEGRVPVDLVAAGREERVLLVRAGRGDVARPAPPRCSTPSLRRV